MNGYGCHVMAVDGGGDIAWLCVMVAASCGSRMDVKRRGKESICFIEK